MVSPIASAGDIKLLDILTINCDPMGSQNLQFPV